jgi:DNA-binding transcriptional LysR family regulator
MADEPTVEQVQALVEVAKKGSYEAAAVELQLDRTALVRRVDRLAKTLNRGPLVLPGGRGLTRVGETVLFPARRFVAAVESLHSLRDEVRFSTYPTIAGRVIERCPGLLEVEQTTPLVLHDISEASRHDGGLSLVRAVANGDLDLTIAPSAMNRPELREDFLYSWTLQIVLPPGHTLRREAMLRPDQLEGLALVAAPATHRSRHLLEEAFQADEVPLKIDVESPNQHLLRQIALSSKYHAAALPSDAFWPLFDDGARNLVTATGDTKGGRYAIYTRKRRSANAFGAARDKTIDDIRQTIITELRKTA